MGLAQPGGRLDAWQHAFNAVRGAGAGAHPSPGGAVPSLRAAAGMPAPELQAALKEPQRKAACLQVLKQLQLVLAGYCGLMDGARGCSRGARGGTAEGCM